jgi:hypothetical protein
MSQTGEAKTTRASAERCTCPPAADHQLYRLKRPPVKIRPGGGATQILGIIKLSCTLAMKPFARRADIVQQWTEKSGLVFD